MSGRRFSPAEKKKAISSYLAGGTTVTVANELGCAPGTVSGWLKNAGIPVDPTRKKLLRYATQETRDRIRHLFDGGRTAKSIADELDVSYNTVIGELKRQKCDLWGNRNRAYCKFGRAPGTRQRIARLYEAGASMNALSKDYKCSVGAVQKALELEGVDLRGRAQSHGIVFKAKDGRQFCMRSSWEVRVAVWFESHDRIWDYEQETFVLPSGKRYTPDFWVWSSSQRKDLKFLIDVKGYQRDSQIEAIEEFRDCNSHLPFEIWDEERLQQEGVFDLPLPELRRVGRRCRTPKWKIDLLIDAYVTEGLTIEEAGARAGFAGASAGYHLRRLGITRSSSASKQRKSGRGNEWLRRLVALHRKGVSLNEIGRQLGVNSGTVHYHLNRLRRRVENLDGDFDFLDVRMVARIAGV